MSQYEFEEAEWDDDDRNFDRRKRRFAKKEVDQPKRTPIRRKDKMRSEEEVKPKAKRNHKKLLHRIKYEWQEE
jgi:hypothetical protein